MKIIVFIMMSAIIIQLFSLQMIHGEEYKKTAIQKVSTTTIEEAPRGDILDRYGRPLITNRIGYSLKMQKTSLKNAEVNEMVLKLLKVLEESGYEYKDTLPFSYAPYSYDFVDENNDGTVLDEKEAWFSDRKKITADMTPAEIMDYYENKVYYLNDKYTEDEKRSIIGLRYDAEISGFSATNPYTIAEDVNLDVISKIKERGEEFPGVYVSREYFRSYEYETLGAHILGGIGKMNAEEFAELKDKGYGYSDLVGKRGIEKIMESSLRGVDGRKNVLKDLDEDEDVTIEDIPAEPGNYVTLTLDVDLQIAAEKSLETRIKNFASRGLGTNAGAAVVLDIRNGDVLACANYPTYNPETFNKDYNELIKNEANPIWNRAISGTYTPGSTLKPLIAIAALESGAVGVNEKLICNGIYDYYSDYKPKCWYWSSEGKTHGMLSVSQAIGHSCNCYFYEAGRRCGIDKMNEYAKMYGLGELTGIEFSEEAKGAMSNPEYKKTKAYYEEDKKWYAGDVIQTAIGQSYSTFTPIQLANYISAIANGGTLYKTHIIKSIRSSSDGSLVDETDPVVLNKIEISESTLNAVKKGMFGVADEGSASSVFDGYPIAIGGKTGTAQVGKNKSENALFVAFAPYENPEIAVAVVLEKGETGANAAYVARDIFDEYFRLNKETENFENFDELLP